MQNDTARAIGLRNAEWGKVDAAVERLRDAVRAGDVEAMRAAYGGSGSFLIGLASTLGKIEHMVLEETLNSDAVPLEAVLGVFFRELGGRFLIDERHNVSVFSRLVLIDANHHYFHSLVPFSQEEEAEQERWDARMSRLVRFLANDLGMPIRAQLVYCVRPLTASAQLMQLAWATEAWSCYFAFADFITPAPYSREDCVGKIVSKCSMDQVNTVHDTYWVRRLGPSVADNDRSMRRITLQANCEAGQELVRSIMLARRGERR